MVDFFQPTSLAANTATSTSATRSIESAVEAASGVTAPCLPPPGSSNPHQSTNKTRTNLASHVSSNPTLKAEICWTIKVVTSHYSYKSCAKAGDIFRTMFPDSDIAKQFSSGERKVAYLATFGISPHFSSFMKTTAKKESGYALIFDESLNQEMKICQIDMHVRFSNNNQVHSRYLTRFFMGHHAAEQIHEKLCSEIGFQNLIQLSMDGPNVNCKVFSLTQKNIEKQTGRQMLNVGNCGFHRLGHGSSSGQP